MFTRYTWKPVPSVIQAVRRRYGGNKQFENYYDILQVRRDSTEREIRAAFVSLSKQFHPDTKGVDVDPLTTAKFVKISEAYQVLSRPSRRKTYDQQLWARGVYGATYPQPPPPPPPTPPYSEVQTTRPHRNWEVHTEYDPNPQPGNYYGFEGIEKVSNTRIASILIVLGLIVCALGSVSIIQAFDMQRQELDRKSAEAASFYEAVRADAKKYGNEEQLRRLSVRLNKED